MVDPIWWFYLFWVPDFLQRRHGLSRSKIGVPIMVIYLIADVGSVGWRMAFVLADQRGKSLNASRKIAMLICALCVVPIILRLVSKASGARCC